MNQIIIGFFVPFSLAAIIYILRSCRASLWMFILTPVFMGLSALWAIMPDLPRIFGLHDLYMRLSFDPRCDIFFFHYTIDQMETDSIFFIIGFMIILLSLLLTAWRELYLTEKGE